MNIKTFLIMPIRAFATYGNTQVKIKSLSPIFKRQLAVMVFLIISILPITAQETNQTSKEKQKVESSRLPFNRSYPPAAFPAKRNCFPRPSHRSPSGYRYWAPPPGLSAPEISFFPLRKTQNIFSLPPVRIWSWCWYIPYFLHYALHRAWIFFSES